jgi:hypothetical protein
MGIKETGVRVSLYENTNSSARRIADDLNQVANSADRVSQSLDPSVLDEYNRKLTEIGQNYHKTQVHQTQQQASLARTAMGISGAATSGLTQTMASGDVVGGAIGGARGLTGLLAGLGPLGIAAGIGIAGLGVTNMAANYYYERSGPSRQLAGMQGLYGHDIAENSRRLRGVMNRVIDQVSEYGMTYEEGTAAVRGFLLAGGSNLAGTRSAQYSAAYGVDANRAFAFEGLGQRFGQNRGLQATRALMRSTGVGEALFGELMGGIEQSFSQSLSMGIVRGMEEIARTQSYFGGAGSTWTGNIGQQRVAQLDQAARGAVGLGSETDIFMYRAASEMARANGGGILETRAILERGMTPELFQGVRGQLSRYGYGRTESILQMSRMFGISTTAAQQLFDMGNPGQEDFNTLLGQELGPNVGKSIETEYEGGIQRIKQGAANLGARAFDTKQTILDTGEKFLRFLENALAEGMQPPDEIAYAGITVKEAMIVVEPSTAGGLTGNFASPRQYGAAMAKKAQALQMGINQEDVEGLFNAASAAGTPGGNTITASEGERIIEKLEEMIAAIREPSVITAPTPEEDPSLNYRGW